MRGGGARSSRQIVARPFNIAACLRRNSAARADSRSCPPAACFACLESALRRRGRQTGKNSAGRPNVPSAACRRSGRAAAKRVPPGQPAHGDGPATFGIMPPSSHSSLPAGTAESSRPCASFAFGPPIAPGNSRAQMPTPVGAARRRPVTPRSRDHRHFQMVAAVEASAAQNQQRLVLIDSRPRSSVAVQSSLGHLDRAPTAGGLPLDHASIIAEAARRPAPARRA